MKSNTIHSHSLYGGENAYLIDEYLNALKADGIERKSLELP